MQGTCWGLWGWGQPVLMQACAEGWGWVVPVVKEEKSLVLPCARAV